MVKITLDAGHGLYTAGKRTPDDEREWSFNNKVLLACVEELNKYENVEILRTDDPTGKTDVPLNTRTNSSIKWGAEVSVSIHANAKGNVWDSKVTGTETFTYLSPTKEDLKLAEIVHNRLIKATLLRDRGIKKGDLHMCRVPKAKARILVETGFMDSTIDIKYLRNDVKLKETGIAIAQGIVEYANLKLKQVTVPTKPTIPTTQGGSRKLKLQPYQRNEMANIYKKLQDKKVFTTDWSTKLKKDDVTVDDVIYLLHTMIDRLILK